MLSGIKETLNTPSVRIIRDEHRVVISGQSRLEDPTAFFEELTLLLNECIHDFKIHASVDFLLNYLNSSSSKWVFHILKGIQNEFQGKKMVTINWFYNTDDESMLEAGEVFQSLLSIPFNLIETDR